MDLRPLSFTDNKKGLLHLADSLFKAGKATPISDRIDPKSLLPSTKTVSKALSKLVNDKRNEYKRLLPGMSTLGGGVTTDGVTLKVQEKQFYDLTLHYIEYSSTSPFETTKFYMRCRTLLLQEKTGSGNAERIRGVLTDVLKNQYGMYMDTLTTGFRMVTDNASVMARVANSSVSSRVAPLNEKWMGCLVHQLNTAMKCCIAELGNDNHLSQIFNDVQAVKKIVRIFKQSNWNSLLPEGGRLLQEVETRFGTTFLVVQRFLKSSSLVEEIVYSRESSSARDAFACLHKSVLPSGVSCYPALEAVVDAFQDVINLQRDWEASNKPTIHLALAKFQICSDTLQTIVDGGSVWRGKENGFIPAPRLSRILCRSTLGWLEAKVRIHPLMMAATYLNPLFREFQFISDMSKRRSYRSTGEAVVRTLVAKLVGDDTSTDAEADCSESGSIFIQRDICDQPPVVGRKRTFSLLEYADSQFQSTTSGDEVSKYNQMDISQLPIDRSKYMRDEFPAVRFCYMHRSTFPHLLKVAMRLYATPVSPCASERVFSAVNRIVTRDRCNLSSETLEEIIVARSLLSED